MLARDLKLKVSEDFQEKTVSMKDPVDLVLPDPVNTSI